MERSDFTDYYELLEISPNANSGTVDRVFRYFAQMYHPDNPKTGDRSRFDLVMEAHEVLGDAEKRAKYDVQYRAHSEARWKIAEKVSERNGIDRDADIQNKLLAILYAKRRQNIKDPGLGNVEFERLLACPLEHLEFHFWYLKEKGWIAKTETGTVAITVNGVDHMHSERRTNLENKLLTDRRQESPDWLARSHKPR